MYTSDKVTANRAALIVGCGGIGSAIALQLHKKFPKKIIFLADRIKPSICNESDKFKFLKIDLAKDNIEELAELNLDMLILTAGIGRLSNFETFTNEEITKNFAVNALSLIKVIKLYYDKINSNSDFYCAVISSIAGIVASPLYSIYSATKASLVKFIEAVNAELNYKGISNRILDIAPGKINGTGFHSATKTEQSDNELISIANSIIENMLDKNQLYIPKFDETYSRVINSYYTDPIKFAEESIKYKVANNKLNDKPQIKVGYLTGTFDLFHIGHLNLLRNAKQYCDKLIVGIHPDGKHKNKEVFIPLEERMEIVKNIKYVDEVMVCSDEDIDDYPKLKFNFLFVGSDYFGTERFKRYEEYLADKDAQVIYLPYTQKTSSTYLRGVISDKLSEKK